MMEKLDPVGEALRWGTALLDEEAKLSPGEKWKKRKGKLTGYRRT